MSRAVAEIVIVYLQNNKWLFNVSFSLVKDNAGPAGRGLGGGGVGGRFRPPNV